MNHWQRREAIARIEETGVEVAPAQYPGWTFCVRPDNEWNAHKLRAMAALAVRPDIADYLKRYAAPGGYEPQDGDAEIDQDMQLRAFAAGCVASWSGVTDRKGKPFAFMPENVVALLAAFPDIYAELRRAARNPAAFVVPDAETQETAIEGN